LDFHITKNNPEAKQTAVYPGKFYKSGLNPGFFCIQLLNDNIFVIILFFIIKNKLK